MHLIANIRTDLYAEGVAGPMAEDGVRLNKFIAEAGVASRRAADRLIEEGNVTINGRTAVLGDRVSDGDRVCVSGKPIRRDDAGTVILAFNKPRGLTCTADPGDRDNVIDFINYPRRIFTVGRLDKDSEGLLLLTNDGEFAHRVISPKQHVTKEYYAETDGDTDAHDAEAFARGITLKDGLVCLPAELIPQGRSCTVIVQEGKYHQVRRMLAAVGKPVTALRRLAIGALRIENLRFENGICELSPPQISQIFIK